MKHSRFFVLCLLAIFLSGCKNRQLVSGRLKNMTGLETCGWIIELDKADTNGNIKLEPGNLQAFTITLKEGQAVKLRYKEVSRMSTCMAGKPVEIEMIKDK